MINYILLVGALLGLTSVGGNAYVEHILADTLDAQKLAMIKTALHYHALYAVVISTLGLICQNKNDVILKLSAWIFIVGIILFCFSLYFKVLMGATTGMTITPIGGTLLMAGWILLACSSFKKRRH